MDVDGISFHCQEGRPTNDPTNYTIFVPQVGGTGAHLQKGDTVLIQGINAGSSFVALIIGVRPRGLIPATDNIPFHPNTRATISLYDPVAYIQLLRHVNDDNIFNVTNNYAPPPIDIQRATVDVPEVAPTNLTLYVASEQIININVIIHGTDAVNQTFGPVAGRIRTSYYRFYMHCNVDNTYNFELIPQPQLQLQLNAPSTYTQLVIQTILMVNMINTKLLTKSGVIREVAAITQHMSFQSFKCLLDLIQSHPSMVDNMEVDDEDQIIDINTTTTQNSKQVIIHNNLSIESKRVETTKHTITCTHSQYIQKKLETLQGPPLPINFH